MSAFKRQRSQNSLALAVLALLFERPMHPYEMAATMRERHKEESIKLRYGSLYTVVEALRRDGLITPQETLRDGRRPERTVYTITPDGKTELIAWMQELLRLPVKEYPQFVAALSLLPVLPPAVTETMLRERLQHIDLAIQTRGGAIDGVLRSGLPPLFLIEAEYELTLMEAERRFVEELVEPRCSNVTRRSPIACRVIACISARREVALCMTELFEAFAGTCGRPPRALRLMTEHMQTLISLEGFGDASADSVEQHRSVSRITLRQVLLSGLSDRCGSARHSCDTRRVAIASPRSSRTGAARKAMCLWRPTGVAPVCAGSTSRMRSGSIPVWPPSLARYSSTKKRAAGSRPLYVTRWR